MMETGGEERVGLKKKCDIYEEEIRREKKKDKWTPTTLYILYFLVQQAIETHYASRVMVAGAEALWSWMVGWE